MAAIRAAAPPRVVVMGVSASGKSSVAEALSLRLQAPWGDADELHSPENIAKMASGEPLTDEDRWPWLDSVGRVLDPAASPGGIVMACSALRRVYRDRLRTWAPDLKFVHLSGAVGLLERRADTRTGHFMPSSLLASQLAALEPLEIDEVGIRVDIDASLEEILGQITRWLSDPEGG